MHGHMIMSALKAGFSKGVLSRHSGRARRHILLQTFAVVYVGIVASIFSVMRLLDAFKLKLKKKVSTF